MHVARVLIAALAAAASLPAPAAAQFSTCPQRPDPARWLQVGTPDKGQPVPLIMPHRGGPYMAPEETRFAYETALAYGADGFEGDVRMSEDGEFILSHDTTTGRLANDGVRDGGPLDRPVKELTVAELKAHNVANHGPFAASAEPNPKQIFNPAQILTVAEALEIAERHDVGMDLELKEVSDPARLANLVAQYPKAFRKTFFEADPHEVLQMRQAQPGIQAMHNISGEETPGMLYALTQAPFYYTHFGSTIFKFTPERIAEIHDGCALAIPHDYDRWEDGKADPVRALREGRARGTDGAQTDWVEIATAIYGRPVATRIEIRGPRRSREACLLNVDRGLGLPFKQLKAGTASLDTALGGCVALPRAFKRGRVAFAGDDSALASSKRLGGRASDDEDDD